MKLYVLIEYYKEMGEYYSNSVIVGVFDSEEKAQKFKEKICSWYPDSEISFEIKEYELNKEYEDLVE